MDIEELRAYCDKKNKAIDAEAEKQHQKLNDDIASLIKKQLIEKYNTIKEKPTLEVGSKEKIPKGYEGNGLVKEIDGIYLSELYDDSLEDHVLLSDGLYIMNYKMFNKKNKEFKALDYDNRREVEYRRYLKYGTYLNHKIDEILNEEK